MVKDIICLIQGRNLFDSNQYLFDPKIFCLNQKNFVSLKQNISLHQRKCFIQIVFLIQSNIFSECVLFTNFNQLLNSSYTISCLSRIN